MATIEEQIRELEEQISKTKYNKATEGHIGKLKAKIARLTEEEEKRRSSKGSTKGFYVKKAGNATVALVGFPSVGKSTLLNQLTGAKSEVGAYHFTTLDVVPGVMHYNHAKIQILDMPGLIKDASRGKGRGREVIAAARSADVILLVVDIFNPNMNVLFKELYNAGIRLNQIHERPVQGVVQRRYPSQPEEAGCRHHRFRPWWNPRQAHIEADQDHRRDHQGYDRRLRTRQRDRGRP